MASCPVDEKAIDVAVFCQYRPSLEQILLNSLLGFAERAFGLQLINEGILKRATDKNGQTTYMAERASMLLNTVMENMGRRMKSASDIMKGFLEAIEESTTLHQFISKQKNNYASQS